MTPHSGTAPLCRARSDVVETPLSHGAPSTAIRCTVLIVGVKLALETLGFARTLRWIRRMSPLESGESAPHSAAALERGQRTAFVVARAAALYPGRALCLEQSLVLYLLLRRAAIDARLRLGVQSHPFLAHSWVELDGRPLNDFPEHLSRFLVLPEVPT